jgi:hypothetical protein
MRGDKRRKSGRGGARWILRLRLQGGKPLVTDEEE